MIVQVIGNAPGFNVQFEWILILFYEKKLLKRDPVLILLPFWVVSYKCNLPDVIGSAIPMRPFSMNCHTVQVIVVVDASFPNWAA